MLRVAQRLGERTGAWVQGFLRGTGPAVVATPAGFFDDGVYDDPFASGCLRGRRGVARLGRVAEEGFHSRGGAHASGPPLEGDALREDRIMQAGVSLSLPLPSPGAFSLALALDYGFTRSRSNDAYYDYRSHAVGLALTVSR